MRLPLPKNKLVIFSLVGGLLATFGSIALAAPSLLDAPAAFAEGPAVAAFSDPSSAFFDDDELDDDQEDDDGWEREHEDDA